VNFFPARFFSRFRETLAGEHSVTDATSETWFWAALDAEVELSAVMAARK
jgi:hypothetical protein